MWPLRQDTRNTTYKLVLGSQNEKGCVTCRFLLKTHATPPRSQAAPALRLDSVPISPRRQTTNTQPSTNSGHGQPKNDTNESAGSLTSRDSHNSWPPYATAYKPESSVDSLVHLGSRHYCPSTWCLSTWSSPTSLNDSLSWSRLPA